MLTVEDALSVIVESAAKFREEGRFGGEEIPLDRAYGRVLAEDAASDIDIPPFDKSAVDGYAVRSRDLADPSRALRVASVLSAGEVCRRGLVEGECVKIMTGAPVPEGADAIVMVEDTVPLEGGSQVRVRRAPPRGGNICLRGEDTKRGQTVLSKGSVIGAPEVAILASVGKGRVSVARKPAVGVLSTGSEIVEPESALDPGKIRNSNGPMLRALALAEGCAAEYLGIAGDDEGALRGSLERGLGKDLLLVSGGVSMGDYDLVPKVLRDLGTDLLFHKVRVKPGKPLLFGRREGCLVFGIPGNPVSSFVVFHLFVKPAIEIMAGRGNGGPRAVRASLGVDFSYRSDRVYVVPSRRRHERGRLLVEPLRLNGSADIVACAGCDCLLLLESGGGELEAGSEVDALLI